MESYKASQDTFSSKLLDAYRDLLPKQARYEVTGEFSSFYYCNAVRRVIINEMKRYALVVDPQDIVLAEKNYSSDLIADRLRYMCISQDYPHLSAELDVENKTTSNIEVYSSDLKFKSLTGLISWEKVVEKYPLMTLEPGCAVSITNIKAEALYAYEKKGSPSYAVVSSYVPGNAKRPSTLKVKTLPFTPKDVFSKAIHLLIQRFNVIKEAIETENTSIVQISQVNKLNQLTFFNETMTIGNILHKKILEMEPSIPCINCTEEHPSRRSFMLVISHPTYQKVILKAITDIIKDLSQKPRVG